MKHIVPAGARRIAPGVYDHDGSLHLVIPELLEHAGLPDTRHNREALACAALNIIAETIPDAHVSFDFDAGTVTH